MKANLDGGTSVGFSSEKWDDDVKDIGGKLKIPCKEHEWGAEWTTTSVRDVRIICSKCGVSKLQNEIEFPNLKPTDFHIKENLKVISDNEWEDIWKEYLELDLNMGFIYWLKENYTAPGKK